MSMLVALHHVTHYSYDRSIKLEPQTIRLRPAPHTRSQIQSYSLKILPKKHFINWQQDPFGNYLARTVFPSTTSEFRVEVDLVTEIRPFNPFDFFLEKECQQFPFPYHPELREELAPYLEIKERGPLLTSFVSEIPTVGMDTISFLVELNKKVYATLQYLIRLEPGVQSCEEISHKSQWVVP
ncbi:MAG: transglutaminase N-terminal domain-containing protein [Zavarzinella sp.]